MVLLPLLALLAAAPAPARSFAPESFHLMSIREVYPGSEAAPNAQYLMLQMWAGGQNFVVGKQVRVFDRSGALASTFTFPGDVPVGTNQATILLATAEAQTFFAPGGPLTADLVITATLPALGGKACFFDPDTTSDIDCVAWGGYTGVAGGVGTPFNSPVGLTRGVAMQRRLDICGSPAVLDSCDDTDDSANDFRPVVPAPRNNPGTSGAVPPSSCGNGAVQSLEQCDDGNTAAGDGCSASCQRETNAFAAQALAVDAAAGSSSDGNGVLEPGEQVAVEPSWRNAATATLPLTGALSTFSGPGSALYAIADGTGSYGSLPAGSTVSCAAQSDCYGLSLSSPASRPSTHWDAATAEVASSNGFKSWALHVGDSFSDIPRTSPFYRFVEILLHRGVSGGCTTTAYCPADAATREQMAVFVLVAKEGQGYSPAACSPPNLFADVPETSPFCRFVEELANRGVVSGCGGGNYCPGSPVTREQMSVFVLLTLDPTLDPPPCVTAPFSDVPPSSPFCRWIAELANRGIVSGCGGGNYCPTAAVTREQMGVFIGVSFGLTLYGI